MAGGMGGGFGGFGGGFRPQPWTNFGQQPMYGPANQPATYGPPQATLGQDGVMGWDPYQQQFPGQRPMWNQPMWNPPMWGQPFGGLFNNWQGWNAPQQPQQQQPQQQLQQQATPFQQQINSQWRGGPGSIAAPQGPSMAPNRTADQMLAQLRQFQGR